MTAHCLNEAKTEAVQMDRPRGAKRMNSVDQHVAQRVCAARKSAGLSQAELAGAIGISWQQLQKYENGQNRVYSGRLYAIAAVCGMPITYFFDDAPVVDGHEPPTSSRDLGAEFLAAGGSDLARHFLAIADVEKRRAILDAVSRVAGAFVGRKS